MRFKVGDRVRIKSLDWYNENKDEDGYVDGGRFFFDEEMAKFCGKVLTIESVTKESYYMDDGYCADWTDEMIEGLVEEEVDLIPKFGEYSDNEPLDIPTMTTEFVKEHGLPCPDGYEFKDENGNVINATKIVLEKKQPKYPESYEECCYVLGFENTELVFEDDYRNINPPKEQWKRLGLMNQLNKLLICRDAYWKIAGEEMGLGKSWEPDWDNLSTNHEFIKINKGCFTYSGRVLVFPTAEMRDAFYENFKDLIEECKELL